MLDGHTIVSYRITSVADYASFASAQATTCGDAISSPPHFAGATQSPNC
jgi:hypothetical protein